MAVSKQTVKPPNFPAIRYIKCRGYSSVDSTLPASNFWLMHDPIYVWAQVSVDKTWVLVKTGMSFVQLWHVSSANLYDRFLFDVGEERHHTLVCALHS